MLVAMAAKPLAALFVFQGIQKTLDSGDKLDVI